MKNNNTDGYDMTTTYYIIKLGDSTDDLYLINDTNDFDLVNKYRKNVVFSTNDEMEASLELRNFIKTTIREFLNENTDKLAFDNEIKFELKRYLQNTIWNKVGGVDERADKLVELHSKFINNVRNKMSANEIAKRLFEYDKNILDSRYMCCTPNHKL